MCKKSSQKCVQIFKQKWLNKFTKITKNCLKNYKNCLKKFKSNTYEKNIKMIKGYDIKVQWFWFFVL